MTNSRKKLFLENILIYGLGSIMNMVIPFLMLPIISRLLPSSEYYGINDTVSIFVSFGSAIIVMGMYDAMYRFFFDKNDVYYKNQVASSTLIIILFNSIIAMIIIVLLQKQLAYLLFSDSNYSLLVIIGGITICLSSINTVVAAPTRINNQRLRYILIQTLIPFISYLFSIILILNGEYIYSLPFTALLSNLIASTVFYILNRKYFKVKYFDKEILKPMLKFGLPLMPVFIFFWILSSVGRIIITNTWGLEYTGIYAAAGKIASISQLIYSAFVGGWQYFAFTTMKDDDYIELISKIFDYLSGISFFATAVLVIILKPIFVIMLPANYLAGITVAPILFISPLILMLRQTVGMHFQVKKLSILGTLTIGIGAMIAVILYFILIPQMGINGAAIASLSGYASALLITIIILKKMKLIIINKRIYFGLIITVLLITLHMMSTYIIFKLIFASLECIILIFLYRNEIIKIYAGIRKFLSLK